MKTVIRIEHYDGIGMFRSQIGHLRRKTVYDFLPEVGDRHIKFNDPDMDHLDIEKENKTWYCAYKSIEQLQKWILKDEFKILFDRGFRVLLLDVTEYQEGEDQIIYTKESIANSKNISSLFI